MENRLLFCTWMKKRNEKNFGLREIVLNLTNAEKTAIFISENATVTLKNSKITANSKRGIAIKIEGNGTLRTQNTIVVKGKVRLGKNATYEKKK